jgi:hypothetical protein
MNSLSISNTPHSSPNTATYPAEQSSLTPSSPSLFIPLHSPFAAQKKIDSRIQSQAVGPIIIDMTSEDSNDDEPITQRKPCSKAKMKTAAPIMVDITRDRGDHEPTPPTIPNKLSRDQMAPWPTSNHETFSAQGGSKGRTLAKSPSFTKPLGLSEGTLPTTPTVKPPSTPDIRRRSKSSSPVPSVYLQYLHTKLQYSLSFNHLINNGSPSFPNDNKIGTGGQQDMLPGAHTRYDPTS